MFHMSRQRRMITCLAELDIYVFLTKGEKASNPFLVKNISLGRAGLLDQEATLGRSESN